jgi:formate dehydrogenase accessory protein FdhD
MHVVMDEMHEELTAWDDREVIRWAGAQCASAIDQIAEEVPVALVYNGIAHAVMLATPQDLHDFATGFSLSEGLVVARGDIFDIEIHQRDGGIEIALSVAGDCDRRLRERRRALAGTTGCGLCGVESLAQAQCDAPVVAGGPQVAPAALARARAALAHMQRIYAQTGAVHAAAWCRSDGEVVCVREDVGRHNALDKLIGALAAAGESTTAGFVLMTSRASYEIVCKAARAGIGLVAAISAPTALAVRIAEASGIALVGFLRERGFTVYAHAGRIGGTPEQDTP